MTRALTLKSVSIDFRVCNCFRWPLFLRIVPTRQSSFWEWKLTCVVVFGQILLLRLVIGRQCSFCAWGPTSIVAFGQPLLLKLVPDGQCNFWPTCVIALSTNMCYSGFQNMHLIERKVFLFITWLIWWKIWFIGNSSSSIVYSMHGVSASLPYPQDGIFLAWPLLWSKKDIPT